MPFPSLPDNYYSTPRAKALNGISPAAVFDPASAGTNAWQSCTTPSTVKEPKILIFSSESTEEFSISFLFTLLLYLKERGFKTITRLGQEWVLSEDSHMLLSAEKRTAISSFNPESDYHCIADQLDIPRKKLLWLDSARMRELSNHLNSYTPYLNKIGYGNDFKFTINNYSNANDLLTTISSAFSKTRTRALKADLKATVTHAILGVESAMIELRRILQEDENAANIIADQIDDLTEQYYGPCKKRIGHHRVIPLIDSLIQEKLFLSRLNKKNIFLIARMNPWGVANYFSAQPDVLETHFSKLKTEFASADISLAQVMLRAIMRDSTTTASDLALLIYKHPALLVRIMKDDASREKIMNSQEFLYYRSKVPQIIDAMDAYLTYLHEPNRRHADLQFLKASNENPYITTIIYFNFPHLKSQYESNYSPTIWLTHSQIIKDFIFTIQYYNEQDRRKILSVLFSKKRSFLFKNPIHLRSLISDPSLIRLIEKNLFLDFVLHFTHPPSVSVVDKFIFSELIDCCREIYGDESITFLLEKSMRIETGPYALEKLLRDGTYGFIDSSNTTIGKSVLHFVALLQKPDMRIYFRSDILVSLAKGDFFLATLILQDDGYRSQLSESFALQNIIIEFPALYSLCEKEINAVRTVATHKIAPRVLEIDHESLYLLFNEKTLPFGIVDFSKVAIIHFSMGYFYPALRQGFAEIVDDVTDTLEHFPSLIAFSMPMPLQTEFAVSAKAIFLDELEKVNDTRDPPDYPDAMYRDQGPSIQNNLSEQYNPSTLYLADVEREQTFQAVDSEGKHHQTYEMHQTGEILSRLSHRRPGIRTSRFISQYQGDEDTLSILTQYPNQENVSAVTLQFKDEGYLEFLRTKIDPKFYYFAFTVTLPPQHCIPILSIHCEEEFVCIIGGEKPINIWRGNDGFHYAYSECGETIQYVVKVEKKCIDDSENLYDSIPKDNPLRVIIDTYRDPRLGFKPIADTNDSTPVLSPHLGYEHWLNELYEQRAGVCFHRAIAVHHAIVLAGFPDQVRTVNINGNHAVVEIFAEEKWHSIDCGGSGNNSHQYHNTSTPNFAAFQSYKTNETDINFAENTTANTAQFFQPALSTNEVHNGEESETSESLRRKKLKTLLVNSFSPKPCESVDALYSFLHHRKIVVCTKNVDQTANALLNRFADEESIFYIDSETLLSAEQDRLIIGANKKPIMTTGNALSAYLNTARQYPEKQYVLMIDIRRATLPPEKLVSINTCFDEDKRTINGVCISDNVCIVSLTDYLPSDSSYLSRQDAMIALRSNIPQQKTISSSEREKIQYDLRGFQDWKKALFGRVVLDNTEMRWDKSDFISLLESQSHIEIDITHFSEDKRGEINYFLAQSTAKGYFDYYGYHIVIPDGIDIFCGTNSYDFSKIEINHVAQNTTAACVSDDQYLINTYSFDLLLTDKRVTEDRVYHDTPGLLKRFEGQALSLVITSALTEAQWWCLFENAKNNNVTLQLHLTPGVALPEACQIALVQNAAYSAAMRASRTHCYITNHSDAFAKEMTAKDPESILIAVEDYTFQDLCYSIGYQKTSRGFSDFQLHRSDLLEALFAGKKVILHGEFSVALLFYLDTFLLPNPYVFINGEKRYFSGTLQLAIEDPDLTPHSHSIYESALKWTAPLNEAVPSFYIKPPEEVTPANVIYDEREMLPNDSLEKADADDFMHRRKSILFDSLRDHAMLQFIGHSGVGKSRLISALQHEDQTRCQIYHELDDLEKWANDKSDKIKILFIDESNIDDKHYTMFSDLKKWGNRTVLVNEKLVQLSDTHKIVFARNPHDYGGGRVSQKLFSDNSIPELYFSDFSPAYIYHALLKPIFNSGHLNITEESFQADCRVFIEAYQKRNANLDTKKHMTVRELQQDVLLYCMKNKNKHFHRDLAFKFKLFQERLDSDFVLTDSSAFTRAQFESFIQIKKLQRNGILPADIGLNGVLIEGAPGVGKSAMIEHMFKYMRISTYVKIDASLPLSQKKIILLDAFRTGKPIWLDEINSCLNDGLEKWINKILTGEDPETGKPSPNPGCFLVASANGIELEGRDKIGPAIRHRCLNLTLQKPTLSDVHSILAHRCRDSDNTKSLADDFNALQSKTGQVTLRGLLARLPNISPLYALAPRLADHSRELRKC